MYSIVKGCDNFANFKIWRRIHRKVIWGRMYVGIFLFPYPTTFSKNDEKTRPIEHRSIVPSKNTHTHTNTPKMGKTYARTFQMKTKKKKREREREKRVQLGQSNQRFFAVNPFSHDFFYFLFFLPSVALFLSHTYTIFVFVVLEEINKTVIHYTGIGEKTKKKKKNSVTWKYLFPVFLSFSLFLTLSLSECMLLGTYTSLYSPNTHIHTQKYTRIYSIH